MPMIDKVMRWTKEEALAKAQEFSTMNEFARTAPGAYRYLSRKALLYLASPKRTGGVSWTKYTALKKAKKYDTMEEFARKANGAYKYLSRHKWLHEVEIPRVYKIRESILK